ncbi:MAG: hypothetical protein ACE5F5_01220 [Acidimicrobiia bacterium]
MDYRSEATYKETRLPVELASTLLPDAYRSEGFFGEEQQQLFAHGWVPVACRTEVTEPSQVVVRNVAGRSVLITMNHDGEYRAFLNDRMVGIDRIPEGDTEDQVPMFGS